MTTDSPILLIEGDPHVARSAEFVLRGLGRIRVATNADEAIAAIRESVEYSVIVTSMAVPGMDDGCLPYWLRELHPEGMLLLTVQHESLARVSEVVNDAGVHRLLCKPFAADVLRLAVRQAHERFVQTILNREQLNSTMDASLEAIAGMLAVVQPEAFGRALRLRRMATLLAEKIGLPAKWEIQIAALFSQFGTLTIPNDLVERVFRGQPITPAERAKMQAASEAMLKLLQPIPRMSRVCEILRRVELVPASDSMGLPAPVGDAERVLALVLAFEVGFAEHGSADEALGAMAQRIERYHRPYFEALREMVGVRNPATLIDLPLSDVRLGQVFAAHVRSPNDLILVARGQPVTPPLLLRIRTDWRAFAAETIVRVIEPRSTPLTDAASAARPAETRAA